MMRIGVLGLALLAAPAAWAEETSVVEKVGGAVKQGAEAAERGIRTGLEAAERGVMKGGEAAARGVGKAGEWVGEKMEAGGEKLQRAAGKPAPSGSGEPPEASGKAEQ